MLSFFIHKLDLLATSTASARASLMTVSCFSTDGLSIRSEFAPSKLLFKSSNSCLALISPGLEDGDSVERHKGLVGGKLGMDCDDVHEEVLLTVDTWLGVGNQSVLDDSFEEIDGGTAVVLDMYGGKIYLFGDILGLKLEYAEKTSGDDDDLLDEVVSVDDEVHAAI